MLVRYGVRAALISLCVMGGASLAAAEPVAPAAAASGTPAVSADDVYVVYTLTGGHVKHKKHGSKRTGVRAHAHAHKIAALSGDKHKRKQRKRRHGHHGGSASSSSSTSSSGTVGSSGGSSTSSSGAGNCTGTHTCPTGQVPVCIFGNWDCANLNTSSSSSSGGTTTSSGTLF